MTPAPKGKRPNVLQINDLLRKVGLFAGQAERRFDLAERLDEGGFSVDEIEYIKRWAIRSTKSLHDVQAVMARALKGPPDSLRELLEDIRCSEEHYNEVRHEADMPAVTKPRKVT